MQRREFLSQLGRGAVGWSLLGPLQAQPAKTGAATRAGFDEAAIGRIERLIPTLLRERAVPGMAIAIVRDGRMIWQRAFGVRDAASNTPVDEHTVFEAASVSKTVFAYAALKLCEQGTLGLDAPLTRYAKKRFIEGDTRLDRVTARHALAHTTGFPEWRAGSPPLRVEANPGERFLYSGEGYFYLQSVMTDVAGRRFDAPCGRYEADFEVCGTDFDAFMRRALLEPLGMQASGYVWHERFEGRAARPHDLQGRPLPQKKPNAADVARYGAAGELRTTVADYAKFLMAVLNAPTGSATLGPALWREMQRPQVKLDPAAKIDGADSWALGWAVQERPTGHVILHSGGQAGFRSLTMASVERRSGFVLFTNSDAGGYICEDARVGRLGELMAPLLAG
jgi:CubicO group peptidase (beta-lactamase class C family)